MSIVFEPYRQSIFVAYIAQTTHIFIGDFVGDKSPHVPQEPVGLILATDHVAVEYRDIRRRVIAKSILKFIREVIGPVLAAGFVAILYRYLKRLPVVGRYPPEDFSEECIEVLDGVLMVHLVHFQSAAFGARSEERRVGKEGV